MKRAFKQLYTYIYSFILVIFISYLSHDKTENCLSLIIPSTIEDIYRCYDVLIISICNSTYFPNEVIIVVSGVHNSTVSILEYLNVLKKCTKRLRIIIRRNKYNAASNRNKGFEISQCPVISYFDSDDIMSRYRIEVLHKIFKEYKEIDIVFHPSTHHLNELDNINCSEHFADYFKSNIHTKIFKRCRKTFIFDGRIYRCDISNGFYVTNGWPTLKRDIMKRILFNESLQSTEDLDFDSKIVYNGYNVGLFKYPLGFYIKDYSCKL